MAFPKEQALQILRVFWRLCPDFYLPQPA